jgi:hypothetical protein
MRRLYASPQVMRAFLSLAVRFYSANTACTAWNLELCSCDPEMVFLSNISAVSQATCPFADLDRRSRHG